MNGHWIVLEWWGDSLPDAVHGPYFNFEEADLRALHISKTNDSITVVCHAVPHVPEEPG